MGVLMGKSLQMSEEVYQAMRSRGYHGEVYLLDEMRLTGLDWFAAVAFTAAAMGAGWIN
jgi:energy-coupling factor transporter transmembrane protein EcfT